MLNRVRLAVPLRRRRRWAAALAAVCAAGVLAGVGTGTYALWSHALPDPGVRVATETRLGFAAGRLDGELAWATSSTTTLAIELTKQDAERMIAAPDTTIAIPFQVLMRADGNAGLSYAVDLPRFDENTLFDQSTLRVFPLGDAHDDRSAQAACTPAAAPSKQPSLTRVDGLPARSGDDTATAYWCLTLRYHGSGGRHQSTATATDAAGAVRAQDTWTAYVVQPGALTLTHTVTRPGAA